MRHPSFGTVLPTDDPFGTVPEGDEDLVRRPWDEHVGRGGRRGCLRLDIELFQQVRRRGGLLRGKDHLTGQVPAWRDTYAGGLRGQLLCRALSESSGLHRHGERQSLHPLLKWRGLGKRHKSRGLVLEGG